MALKVTTAGESLNVENIVVCIYGQPGIGKTTLGYTATKPLLFDFDGGAYRAGNRGDTVLARSWADVATISAQDLAQYETVVIDTAGRALDVLSADIIDKDPRAGRKGGALTLQGYGTLKTAFSSWLRMVRSFGKDIVLLCHADEQRGSDDVTRERLDVQGSSKGEIYKCADLMGRIYLDGSIRRLNFSPTDVSFGKNPANSGIVDFTTPVPTAFLGDVIKSTKSALNSISTQQQSADLELRTIKTLVDGATSLGELDALIATCKSASEDVRANARRVLMARAKELGFGYNKATKAFDLGAW